MHLSGCFVAIVTPFSGDSVDYDALAAHATWLVDEGVRGVVVNGTTGESATLRADEKLRAMNVVYDAVGDRATVVGGVGNNCTEESVDFVRRANDEVRVHAYMSVVPYYNKPSQRGMLAHLSTVCAASTKPVIAYNVPGRTVVGMTAETLIAASRIDNVVAIKEASADLFMDTFVVEAIGETTALLSGDDATAMPFIAIGGHGVISVVGNVAPRLMSDMCAAASAGDMAAARPLHQKVCHVHHLMFSHPNPIPAKAVAADLGFGSADVRLPMVGLEPDELDILLTQTRALGVTR